MTIRTAAELMAQLDVENATPKPPSVHRPRRPSDVVPDFLHRSHDGFVPFARKVGEQWQELGSVQAGQLRGLFANEVLADAMQADSYFGLHGMFRPGRYHKRHQLQGLLPSCRNVDSVRWLTCCHVDLDSYRHGLDVHGTIAAVMRLVDEGKIPPPSVFTMSRGVWCLWHLHDKANPSEPLRSYPDSVVTRWTKVQSALHTACAAIGSDAAARHAATVTRVPGSVNSKNGKRVAYMLPADAYGQPFSYTLDELEAVMLPHVPVVVEVVALPQLPKASKPHLSKRALKGWHGRWHRMQALLAQLRNMRGGWKVGVRSSAMHYVALTLRALKADGKQVQRVLAEHLNGMAQPIGDRFTMADAMRVYRGMSRPRHGGPQHQTIADALDVSPEEAAILSADRKKPFPAASRHQLVVVPPAPVLPRGERTDRRRDAVRRIVDSITAKGVTPLGTDVQAHLKAEGLEAALATVLADMRAIGCPSRQSHRAKAQPAAPAEQAVLPGF